MIKFAYTFTVINLLIAAYYFWHYKHHLNNPEIADWDRGHIVMFLAGSMLWVVCILVWGRTKRDEEEGK
jgi:starvation-inducible outer membrane lipoprotein